MDTAGQARYRPSTNDGHGSPADQTAGDTAEFAKERASALWDDAKESARVKLNEQKDAAAQGIGGVADAMREAARRREAEHLEGDVYSDLGSTAADGLDRLSKTLRSKDVGSMLRDMENFAHQQPVAFFGLALAAGFLGVRFVKASHPSNTDGARATP